MELKSLSADGTVGNGGQGNDAVFAREYNEALIHQIVVAFQANARSANSKQKTRAEVRHSTKKPFRQKGTGNARAGMTSSPLWRGGGKIFPNTPDQNYSHKVNRKMFRAGLASILSQLVREDRLMVVDAFSVDSPKTKALATKLRGMGCQDVLIVTDQLDDNLYLSSRNLANVAVCESHQVDPVSLLAFSRVLVTKAAVTQLEEAYQ